MSRRDAVLLFFAAALVVAGCTLAWVPLGLIVAGLALVAAWYWVLDDVGGEE